MFKISVSSLNIRNTVIISIITFISFLTKFYCLCHFWVCSYWLVVSSCLFWMVVNYHISDIVNFGVPDTSVFMRLLELCLGCISVTCTHFKHCKTCLNFVMTWSEHPFIWADIRLLFRKYCWTVYFYWMPGELCVFFHSCCGDGNYSWSFVRSAGCSL